MHPPEPPRVAYQCIITSASTQYPPTAWLNYNVQFRTLAALDPNLYWDVRHTDLWLQCMTAQSTRWPCTHCGATNHYLDHYPFCPNPSPAITGGQQITTRYSHCCEYCGANHPIEPAPAKAGPNPLIN